MPKTAPFRASASRTGLAENYAIPETGTVLANISNILSCHLASRDSDGKSTWGGARNRADRASDSLTDSDVEAIISAAQFALATGRTFQRHWIIHYGRAGIAETDATRFIGRLLHLVGKQARRCDGKLTALWIREMASGKGGHVHILMHLPVGMKLKNRTVGWIESAGGTYQSGVSMVKIVGGRLARGGTMKAENMDAAHYRVNAMAVTRYLLKACRVETGNRLELTRKGQGGRIIGKRRGWTQNIGAARRRSTVASL